MDVDADEEYGCSDGVKVLYYSPVWDVSGDVNDG